MHASIDIRESARLAWAQRVLGEPKVRLVRASVDAGFRSYWRTAGLQDTCIVMDSPPDKEDVRPWLRLRALLQGGGVRVPKVLAEDVGQGFLLLEDLGVDTYLQVIDDSNADALFEDAITQLLRVQGIAAPPDLPKYDEALLARELRLFDEWFVGRHLGIDLDRGAMEMLDLAYRRLVDAALAQPQVLVHRDFMPRNLMPAIDGPAVLDFQDAVEGPIAYDATSLFKDAFLSWPQPRVDAWLERYHARAVEAALPVPVLAQFRRDADWIGVQRHLKVIGIFARLWHRDGKPKYLADASRFIGYLDDVLPKYDEFTALHEFLGHTIKPTMATLAHAS